MDDISADPIVMYYLKLSKRSEKLAKFSETSLRMAFTQILCQNKHYVLQKDDLELYKKVLILYFAKKFTNTKDLSAFMACYNEATIESCLVNQTDIFKQWQHFTQTRLIDMLYKEAITEMLKEWHKRAMLQMPSIAVNLQILEEKIQQIMNFLQTNIGPLRKFAQKIYNLLKYESRNTQTNTEVTSKSLDYQDIFETVKPKLNVWLVRMVECKEKIPKVESPTAMKKIIMQLKRLPDGTTVGLMEPAKKKGRKKHKKIIVEVEETHLKSNTTTIPQEETSNEIKQDESLIDLSGASTIVCVENELAAQLETEVDIVDNNFEQLGHSSSSTPNKYHNVIDSSTAKDYIEQLKLYALANKKYEALDPLEQVEGIINCD